MTKSVTKLVVSPTIRKRLSARGSKQKGDKYEREVAAYVNEKVFDGRLQVQRAPLSGGGFVMSHGGADLTGMTGLFPEVKRVECLNVRKALLQAEKNCRTTSSPEAPVVITRKSLEPTEASLVVMRLDHWLDLYRAWLTVHGYIQEDDTPAPPVAS